MVSTPGRTCSTHTHSLVFLREALAEEPPDALPVYSCAHGWVSDVAAQRRCNLPHASTTSTALTKEVAFRFELRSTYYIVCNTQ